MNTFETPTRMFCQICGKVHKIDFWVPDEIWDACIHPRLNNTHICVNCFADRADERLLEWDKHIKFFPCSMKTQIDIQNGIHQDNITTSDLFFPIFKDGKIDGNLNSSKHLTND